MAYLFTPATSRARRDGWTADKQHAFIEALARLGSPSYAARSVGMSVRGAWRLRDRIGAEGFRIAWDRAIERGQQAARDAAIERATEGYDVPVIRRGRIVGHYRRYDDRLLLAALQSHAAPPLFERQRAALLTPARQAYEEAVWSMHAEREQAAIARRRSEEADEEARRRQHPRYDRFDWRNYE